MEMFFGLMMTLALIPVIGLAVVHVIREMIMGNVGAVEGTAAIGALAAIFVIAIASQSPIVNGATILIVVTLGAFYPYAESQFARQIGREVNVRKIDRAHEALSARPDNVSAWFALAEGLYHHGFQGHAVAIAEDVLGRLSTSALDPMGTTTMRDIFRKEESALKEWKRRLDPSLAKPLRCPFCGMMNPPGPIACSRCGKAYLLELVRTVDSRKRFVGKLILGWSLLALTICGAAACGMMLKGWWQGIGVLLLLTGAGVILYWLFRPPKGDLTSGWEI